MHIPPRTKMPHLQSIMRRLWQGAMAPTCLLRPSLVSMGVDRDQKPKIAQICRQTCSGRVLKNLSGMNQYSAHVLHSELVDPAILETAAAGCERSTNLTSGA